MFNGVRRLLLAAPLLAGCSALFPYLDPYGYPTDPYFGEPTVPTTYSTGSATIELTRGASKETITLNRVGDSSFYEPMLGAMVTWENDDGWTVMVNSYSGSQLPEFVMPGVMTGDVTINRIDGHEFWTAGSYVPWGTGNSCAVDVWEMSSTDVSGRANCTKLRWTDGMSPGFEEPAYIEGEESFDVSITFEAHSSGIPPGSTS